MRSAQRPPACNCTLRSPIESRAILWASGRFIIGGTRHRREHGRVVRAMFTLNVQKHKPVLNTGKHWLKLFTSVQKAPDRPCSPPNCQLDS